MERNIDNLPDILFDVNSWLCVRLIAKVTAQFLDINLRSDLDYE